MCTVCIGLACPRFQFHNTCEDPGTPCCVGAACATYNETASKATIYCKDYIDDPIGATFNLNLDGIGPVVITKK